MIDCLADPDDDVSEYQDEILEFIWELQDDMLPDPNYMASTQKNGDINWRERSVIILWLVGVHLRYKLRDEILFLAVNYIDRFLSLQKVMRDNLHLTGIIALNIAIKYENRQGFPIRKLQQMLMQRYKTEVIRKAEIFMLSKLQYELGWPGPLIFLKRIHKEINEMDSDGMILAKYFLEAILLDENFVATRPSITAAAAYCVTRCMLGMGEWTPLHVLITKYNYSQLYPLMIKILDWLNQPKDLYHAVYGKYCLPRKLRAALYVEEKLKTGFLIEDIART